MLLLENPIEAIIIMHTYFIQPYFYRMVELLMVIVEGENTGKTHNPFVEFVVTTLDKNKGEYINNVVVSSESWYEGSGHMLHAYMMEQKGRWQYI